MSHWQPGWVLSRHVPPTSQARSRRTKSCMPARLRRTASPSPAKPVPRMAIGKSAVSAALAAGGASAAVVAISRTDRRAGEEEEPDLEGQPGEDDRADHHLLEAGQRPALGQLGAFVAQAAHPRRGAPAHRLAAERL